MLIKKSIIALLTIFLLALMAVPAMAGTTDNAFNPSLSMAKRLEIHYTPSMEAGLTLRD
mgnify:CR=1 FL=1